VKRLISLLLAIQWVSFPAIAETELRMGMSSLPLSFGNPMRSGATPTIYFTPAIFDGLTRLDREGNLLPWLAVAWEPKDTKAWTVTLRDGVTFSNGVPFTAEAAAFAVNYLASEESLQESLRREIPALAGAVAVDDLTVEITTIDAEPLLMRSLSILPMVEPGQWTRLGRDGFGQDPIGTGPFRITGWGPTEARMVAVPTSWRRPHIDRLTILAIPDKSARIQALQSGRIDLGIEFGPEDGVLMQGAGLKVERWLAAETAGLSFILTRNPGSPLQDVRVREALNLAVDRQVLIQVLLEGATVPANQPAPRSAFGYNPDLPPLSLDIDRAKALLAEAGYEDGFAFTAVSVAGIGVGSSVLQIMANAFGDLGVDMEVRAVPIQQFLQFLGRGTWPEDIDAFSMNWPVWPSLDSLRALRLHSCLRREPWYCDESIMPAITAAMAEWDQDKSRAMRQDIMAWYRNQYPAVFMFEAPQFAGMSPRVSGFHMANNIISFEDIKLAD
jgi:peptide/nickel transport system substrate-binding protein